MIDNQDLPWMKPHEYGEYGIRKFFGCSLICDTLFDQLLRFICQSTLHIRYLASEVVLCILFAGQHHLFGILTFFFSQTEKEREKQVKIQ